MKALQEVTGETVRQGIKTGKEKAKDIGSRALKNGLTRMGRFFQ